jgi:hypothetical protein
MICMKSSIVVFIIYKSENIDNDNYNYMIYMIYILI